MAGGCRAPPEGLPLAGVSVTKITAVGCDPGPGWGCTRARRHTHVHAHTPNLGPIPGAPLSLPPVPPCQHLCLSPSCPLGRKPQPQGPRGWQNWGLREARVGHPQILGTGLSLIILLAQGGLRNILWGEKGTFWVGSPMSPQRQRQLSAPCSQGLEQNGLRQPPPAPGKGTRGARCCPYGGDIPSRFRCLPAPLDRFAKPRIVRKYHGEQMAGADGRKRHSPLNYTNKHA